jgi:hypothetical protein
MKRNKKEFNVSVPDGTTTQANTEVVVQDDATKAAEVAATAAAAAAATTTEKKPDAPAAPAAAATPAKKEEVASTKSGPPDKYELKLPDGSRLEAGYVDKIAAYAKAHGLSQDAAQDLLNRESVNRNEYQEAQVAQLKAQSDAWKEEFMNDPVVGGEKGVENAELAHRALKQFADEPFVEELEKTGLGNHPGLMKTFLRIGKAMSDGKFVITKTPGGGGEKKSAEEKFYPNNV